jgi:hypothetical protein
MNTDEFLNLPGLPDSDNNDNNNYLNKNKMSVTNNKIQDLESQIRGLNNVGYGPEQREQFENELWSQIGEARDMNLKFNNQYNRIQNLYNIVNNKLYGGQQNDINEYTTKFYEINDLMKNIDLPQLHDNQLTDSESDVTHMTNILGGVRYELNSGDTNIKEIRNTIRRGLKDVHKNGNIDKSQLRKVYKKLDHTITNMHNVTDLNVLVGGVRKITTELGDLSEYMALLSIDALVPLLKN